MPAAPAFLSLDVGRSALDVFRLNPELAQFIRDRIRAHSPVPFAWFMKQALYHSELGYYSSGRAAIGRRGDYFTNVSVGPLFGQLLTFQFVEVWECLGKIDNFVVVEEGAHHGVFARDMLACARECFADFFAALRYRIVEPFAVLQDRQAQTLASFDDKVEWLKSLEPFVGLHFSNELLDAMPVNLRGKRVGLAGDEFGFVECSDDPETKPNQAALDWVDTVVANLQRGFVIAIDYGYPRSQFRESLQVRAEHRLRDSPFEQIGHSDITMHINWTDIAMRAEANGLRIAGFTDQHHFLTGIISELGRGSPNRPGDWGQSPLPWTDSTRGLQTLLHPEMLGRAFQVLALNKDVDLAGGLSGFKFAREPRVALEL